MLSAAEIYALIEQRRSELGLSQAQLGQRAFGQSNSAAIQNLRRGSSPTAERLAALADALDFDFYFGPKRAADAPPPVPVEIDGGEFATIQRLAAEASAGPGAINSEAEVIGSLAFRRAWLDKIGVNPARACLISVRGDSMAPGLQPGDLALIDHERAVIAPGKVFAFNDVDGETRIKRLERPDDKSLILYSDNQAYAPELRKGVDLNRIKILGQVVWSGHNWA